MSDSMRPHRQQPTRLPHPWDSPGKNTGVGCHFLLQCWKVKSESEVAQSCLTPSDPMDCTPPGSSVHGICQVRIVEWGAIAFSEPGQSLINFIDFFLSETALIFVIFSIDFVSHLSDLCSNSYYYFFLMLQFSSVQFSSVTQSCPTLCNPMNRSTPGLPVHHQLLEFIQTQIHRVSDAIQPSHPLPSPSPASNPSQHQSLFQ